MGFASAVCSKLSATTSKALWILSSALFLSLMGAPEARAVRPMCAAIAMAAGDESRHGFKDGSFTSALFDTPLGMAISGAGNLLFVADSRNNRIRVVHLDRNNDVSTLAGQDKAGNLDGHLTMAQFNDPRGVLYLPGDRLVVNDYGNQRFRLVDLTAGTVTTLAGGPPSLVSSIGPSGSATLSGGPASQVSVGGVRGMAYMPEADSVFYALTDAGTLKMLNLKTGMVSTLLNHDAQIPNPAALWCQGNKLYLADKDLPEIFEIDWKNNAATNPAPFKTTHGKVLSLSMNDNILYALLDNPGVPAEHFPLNWTYNQPTTNMVTFISPWGDTIPPDKYFTAQSYPFFPWMGFVADPSDNRKFYVAKPEFNLIVSFRDLFYTNNPNSNGFIAPEYPANKPKNTYRIIIVGDSRSMEVHDFPFKTDYHAQTRPPESPSYPDNLKLGPEVERELNFQAALDDVPWNYEVFNDGRHGDLLFWPTFDVPDVVKKSDIDLVVIFSPTNDFRPFFFYYDHSLTSDCIPKYPMDLEYYMKPPLERINDGLPRKFYDFCKAHNLVQVVGRNLVFDDGVFAYPEIRDEILQFYGKPLDVLQKKLSAMKTSGGKPVKLLVVFTYTGREWSQHNDTETWIEAAKKFDLPYLDLDPEMDSLHLSYFPMTGDEIHFNPDGTVFFGRLLAHDLIRDKLIPWKDEPGLKSP